MCGIFGAVSAGRPLDAAAVRAATDSLRHRGPDGFGYLWSGPGGVQAVHDAPGAPPPDVTLALASRRLAIIDLVTGQQPISNEDGSVWCVFNGEIYNYRELRRELVGAGHRFRTTSDTEVLCHGYEEWGGELARRLEGMFALALYDRRREQLLLLRDPLGIKPLYYSATPERFCFGSEIKALLAYDKALRLDRDSVFDFFLHDQIPPPRTPFRDVLKLDAGCRLELDCRSLRVTAPQRWFELRFAPRPQDPDDVVRRVEATLERVVVKQSVADVPVGTFLSGGLDSSLVTRALMSHSQTKAIHLYTDDEWSEHRWAMHPAFDRVERVNVRYEPRVQDCIDALASLDDLLRDASLLPTYIVSRAAREAGLKVVLSGDGGDETFLGYDGVFHPAWLYERARALGLPRWGKNPVLFAAFALLSGVGGRYAPGLQGYVRAGGYLPGRANPEIRNLLTTRKLAPADAPADFRAEARDGFSYAGDEPEALHRLSFLYFRYFLNVLLAKVDFASMANSVEVRVPYLDEEMLQLALALPYALRTRRGGKYPLKVIAERYFGAAFAHRPKAGFTFDFSRLFRMPELADFLAGALRRPGVDEFLDVPGVLQLIEVDKTRGRDGKRLWRALMFCEWFENYGRAHA